MARLNVPNEPFRRCFVERRDRGELTLSELARRLGWTRTHNGRVGKPDATRVGRALGLRVDHSRGVHRLRRTIRRSTAERLAKVLNLDPHEVGL